MKKKATMILKFKRRRKIFFVSIALCFTLSIIFVTFHSNFFDPPLKDWNDFDQIYRDSLRDGFGEHGRAESLTDPSEIEENKKLFDIFGLNLLISDKISLNRSIPDFRHPKCLKKFYPKNLPKVSIVIIFNDEAESVFKRTLHSLHNRTPHELIEEVILVNDDSRKGFYGDELESYVKENFKAINFKILNLKTRHGLMRARKIGAKAAKSEFLFMMEPHCEMTYNWLPPLLHPLVDDEKVVTVPIIDNIEWKELQYYENDQGNLGSRGVFDWSLEYQKLPRVNVTEGSEVDPFITPIMTGGIFMIRKKYFFEIGPYDEKLKIWGGENIEMSLKIHLCGGKLMEVPCSRIGHMFRAFTKSRKDETGIDFVTFNRKRIIEVWFDDYKKFVYQRDNEKFEKIAVGDLSEAQAMREKLKCKNFDYFMKEIAPDLIENFPLDDSPFARGVLQLEGTELCITIDEVDPVEEDFRARLDHCGNSPSFELSWYRDLRMSGNLFCLDAYDITKAGPCHLTGGNQLFKYISKTFQLVSLSALKCIEGQIKEKSLKLVECDENSQSQKWKFNEFVNEKALEDWTKYGRKFRNDIFW